MHKLGNCFKEFTVIFRFQVLVTLSLKTFSSFICYKMSHSFCKLNRYHSSKLFGFLKYLPLLLLVSLVLKVGKVDSFSRFSDVNLRCVWAEVNSS